MPILLLLLVAALGACAHADAERDVLQSVHVEGNATFDSETVLDHLALVPTPIWPWADRHYFDRGTLAGDASRLQRFYEARGFYDATVTPSAQLADRQATVLFRVVEGLPTKIRALDLKGLADLPPDVRARIRPGELPLVVGNRLAEADYDATLIELTSRLKEEGYATAQVKGQVDVHPELHEADVHLEAVPGPLLTVGTVVVSGTVRIPRDAVLDRVRPLLSPGQVWRESALQEVRASLIDMGVFGAVSVQRGEPQGGKVPVAVAVTESPMRTLRAGFGGGFEPRREEVRLLADYDNRNFLGGLRLLRLEARLGYAALCGLDQSLGSGLLCFREPGARTGPVGSTAVDLTQQDVVSRFVDANVRLEYSHELDLNYHSGDFLRARLGFPIHLSRSVTLVPAYDLERDFFASTPVEQDRLVCTSGGTGCAVTVSRVEERLAWDRRDDPLETTRGTYVLLGLQQGGGILGGDYNYLGASADLRSYHPLPYHLVLALRAQAGVLVPVGKENNGTPITQRYFAGGASSIRSYGFHALSPMVLSSGCADGTADPAACSARSLSVAVPLGGDQLVAGSAELRIPVVGPLGAVVFTDVASVQQKAFTSLDLNLALGGGLRYRTPFGPVRLDAAVRVAGNPPPLFLPDGTSVPLKQGSFALQFSVGEAF